MKKNNYFPLGLLLITIIVIIIITRVNHFNDLYHDIPGFIGFKPFVVVSDSMSPTLKSGDMIIVKKSNKPYKSGDIITYWRGNSLITHRVVEIKDKGYVTKGDTNKNPDNYEVFFEDIVGKTLLVIPYGGYISPHYLRVSYFGALAIAIVLILTTLIAKTIKSSKGA